MKIFFVDEHDFSPMNSRSRQFRKAKLGGEIPYFTLRRARERKTKYFEGHKTWSKSGIMISILEPYAERVQHTSKALSPASAGL